MVGRLAQQCAPTSGQMLVSLEWQLRQAVGLILRQRPSSLIRLPWIPPTLGFVTHPRTINR